MHPREGAASVQEPALVADARLSADDLPQSADVNVTGLPVNHKGIEVLLDLGDGRSVSTLFALSSKASVASSSLYWKRGRLKVSVMVGRSTSSTAQACGEPLLTCSGHVCRHRLSFSSSTSLFLPFSI
jgi:hypothetical protein